MTVERRAILDQIRAANGRNAVTVLTGPHQSGKTTLARQFLSKDSASYFDLEDPSSLVLLRFWTMIAHYHGQVWNAAEPARALGVSPSTCRRYLDLLTDAMVIRQLPPWHANLGKRQVKSPKLYVRDSGLLHQLLGLGTEKALLSHPKLGASWEGFVIEQVMASQAHDECWFWATHQGAEIDLLLRRGDRLFGVECKRADAPRVTPSIRIALDDLGLEHVAVVYPGIRRFPLTDRVEVVPLAALADPGKERLFKE